jgi:hypothetical protein
MNSYRGKRMAESGWEPSHPPDPKLRLADLDLDGVEAEVIYGIRFIEDSIKEKMKWRCHSTLAWDMARRLADRLVSSKSSKETFHGFLQPPIRP